MKRGNLTVKVRAHASRVVLVGHRATGVEYIQGGRSTVAHATREVILRGGAFNSPQFLMLSGIGPADHLRSARHRAHGRSAGRQESAGPSGGADHVRPRRRQRVPRQHAARPHGDQHAARLPVRHRSGHRRSGRPARLHQDPPRACGARHRVHVPRRAAGGRALVPGLEAALRGRLRHPAVPAASGQPRRGAAALVRPARSGARS